VCACVTAGEEIDIHNTLADTMSLNDWVNFFANDEYDSDFKPILDLDLYGEHMSEERITGSKIGLDLSDRVDLYASIYTVNLSFPYLCLGRVHRPNMIYSPNC